MTPEVKVHLWSGLRAFADGQEAVTVKAKTVGGMLDALAHDYPGLSDAIDQGVSVSIDGKVIASSLREAVRPDQDIWLMMRLRGG